MCYADVTIGSTGNFGLDTLTKLPLVSILRIFEREVNIHCWIQTEKYTAVIREGYLNRYSPVSTLKVIVSYMCNIRDVLALEK